MPRRSFQAGCLQWHNGQWTLLYWLLDHQTGDWKRKRESAALKSYRHKDDKKAAKEAAREFLKPINELNSNPMAAAQQRAPKNDAGLTFARFLATRWDSYLTNKKLEPSTTASYGSIIKKHLLPAFGERQIAEITKGDMTDFFDGLRGKLADKTLLNIFNLLDEMFDLALDYDFISSSPVRKKLHKPEFEKQEKPILAPEVVSNILMKLPYAHRLFIVMMTALTIRSGEGLALRWLNVDFETRVLQLTHSLWRGKLKPTLKTKSSKRRFILPETLVKALEVYRLQSEFNAPEDFIFPNKVGGPLEPGNFRKRVLYPVMDDLGIKREDRSYGFHILRHTAATIIHEETGDIEVTQLALGHASRATTEGIYDHAELVVGEEIVQMVLGAIVDDFGILEDNPLVN